MNLKLVPKCTVSCFECQSVMKVMQWGVEREGGQQHHTVVYNALYLLAQTPEPLSADRSTATTTAIMRVGAYFC